MNLLDIRTIVSSHVITNAIGVIVMTFLWIRNRNRFAGLGLWLVDFVMHFIAVLLVSLRGSVPDFLSIVVSNTLVIAGTILLLIGLERFVGKRTSQIHNYLLLAAFVCVHSYFTFVHPSLLIRTINLSVGIILLCAQCAWLLIRRVDAALRSITRGVGYVFLTFCAFSAARIIIDLFVDPGNDFFQSDMFEALAVLANQMLFIILTFGLLLMVNQRLVVDLESDIVQRGQVEESLRLSEEKFYKAFHSSPDAILISRLRDGLLVDVNDGFTALTGYSRREALAHSSLSLPLWANLPDRDTYIRALQANQRVRDHEYDFRTKSGKILHGLFSGEIIQLKEEPHILTVVRDITERKMAEETLRESENRFRSLFENMLSGYAYCKMICESGQPKDFIYLEVNDAFVKLTGLKDVTGKRVSEIIPGIRELNPELFESYHRVSLTGEPEKFETYLDALGIWFSISVYSPKSEHFVAVFENITERRQAEEELRKLSRAVEQSQVSVIITDTSGAIEYVNPKFCEVTGYTFEEVRGRNPRILRAVGASPELYRELWNTILAGRKWHGEFHNQKKNGELFWESTIISPIMNEHQIITHFVAVKEDITERKQKDEILRHRTNILAALHQIVLDLVNRHEMDEILQTLLGNIGVLLDVSDASIDLIENNDTLVTYAATPNQPLVKGDTMRRGEGGWLSWQAVETAQPAILGDYSTWSQRREVYEGFPIHAIAIIPIHHRDHVIGTINFSRREPNKPFNETDIYVAEQLAEMVALVLDNAQLYAQLQSELAERKRVEENLRESRENFQRYFNVNTVGMCVIAPDRHWIETNGRLRQMLGYSAEELDNLTWSEITHTDDLDADLALFNQLLANERDSYQLDKRFIRKDGAIVYTTIFVSCYRNPDGSVRYCLASLVDITERTLAKESLLKLAAIEERQRLARDLHDSVNQSIHGLLLFSETLVSTLEKNNVDRARQIADRLQESARQALKETRLMLYEMQTTDPERSVNLVKDLETRLVTVERRAGVKAQILQEGSVDHCPPAWHENLFWITIEALNNALKHAQARNMQIKIRCSSKRVELEIVDDGIGFDPSKPRVGGLGLQNMRDRASLLGGELAILSTPKKGSCVRFIAEIKE